MSEKQMQPTEGSKPKGFEPQIVAFFCNWCTYTAADLAGVSRMKYAPNVRIIRVMCSGRVDPQFIMKAFAQGADGVLIGGCHPGDCHYSTGNYKCLRRMRMVQRILQRFGLQKERFRLEWISGAEGDRVRAVVNEMVEQVRKLGPLDLPGKMKKLDEELAEHEMHVEPAREAAHV